MATIQELLQQADRGSAAAQHELAQCYAKGQNGLSRDNQMATYWFEKAASCGNNDYKLSFARHLLKSGDSDAIKRGFSILSQLAKTQYTPAYGHLADCYFSGKGVSTNRQQAAHWAAKACVNGCVWTYFLLGRCFEQGQGVQKDLKYALGAYYRGAQKSDAECCAMLAKLYYEGAGTARDYEKAFYYAKKASDMNCAAGHAVLGMCYFEGNGVTKDRVSAYRLFQTADKMYQDFTNISSYYLGICYYYGIQMEKNQRSGLNRIRSVASSYPPAALTYAQLRFKGDRLYLDHRDGLNVLSTAVDAGYAPALSEMGDICLYGNYGHNQDLAAAIRYLSASAEMGDKRGQELLARCYSYGWGVAKDMEKMRYWSECASGLRQHHRVSVTDPAAYDPVARILPASERKSELDKAMEAIVSPLRTQTRTVTTTTTYSTPQDPPKTSGDKPKSSKTLAQILLEHVDKLEFNIPEDAKKPAAPAEAAPKTAPAAPKEPPKPVVVTPQDRKKAEKLAADAYNAYRSKSFAKAFELGTSAAKLDPKNSKAALLLGWLYHHGVYVSEDRKKALEYFYISEEPLAYNCIGCYHYNGWGGKPVNKKEAASYFSMAAVKNEIYAMCNLAWCYGQRISPNDGDSAKKMEQDQLYWLEKAADQHCMRAYRMLMRLYTTSAKQLEKYNKQIKKAQKHMTYCGVIQAEKDAVNGSRDVTMGILPC